MAELWLAQRDQATLQALTQEVITTSAIEGVALNLDAVRSSIARRLGVDIGALAPADRHVDGAWRAGQAGGRGAEYGQQLLKQLAKRLSAEFGNGFSHTNLKVMRQFYVLYVARIGQTLSDLLVIGNGKRPFTLSWSHYVFLLGIKKDANIHAREYQLYLPSKEELQQKLAEWSGDGA